MSDPGFKVEDVRREEPFRARGALSGYWVFEDDANGAVLVGPDTAQQLSSAAAEATQNETGGLLAGRTLRDGQGSYVLISGYVEAPKGAGQGSTFHISPQATDQLRQKASRLFPTADVVGWWHTHLRPSGYSGVDLTTQAMWTQEDSVGLLVFSRPERPEFWARAYLGPQARDLGPPSRTIPEAKAGIRGSGDKGPGEKDPGGKAPSGKAPSEKAPGPESDGRSGGFAIVSPGPFGVPGMSDSRRRRLTITILVALLLLIVIIVFAIFLSSRVANLSSQVRSEQRVLLGGIRSGRGQLAGQIRRAMAASTRPAISFECSPGSPGKTAHTVEYSCAASASVKSGTIQWLLDGGVVAKGSAAMIPVPDTGSHQIVVILRTATWKVRGVPLTVGVAPASGAT